ncbi:unnamed protein product [Parnassius apollo]|uniref:(apollo) hypothetical protein n=1 Tax=Parnassius apollo TaxID=110799 RepID=A0A8S3XAW1_PARAO|nr:unnamed protein product [Parnassius apollo]
MYGVRRGRVQVAVSLWCGVAGTLNPVARGYGGRRALPAALRRLTLAVCARVPPAALLARRLLAARCLPAPQLLAEDLHAVFALARRVYVV